MLRIRIGLLIATFLMIGFSCNQQPSEDAVETTQIQIKKEVTAKDILGNPAYQAISYGGYRQNTREIQPTVEEVKEDMKVLFAMGIRILRTYNTKLRHATTVLEAIHELKQEDSNFEMYMMVGAWIDCAGAWTDHPNHEVESVDANAGEIERAVEMANKYPDIVKVIAVGNEAMVKWAASYFVQPWVILKWVNHLQELKKMDKLPKDLWVTSSDNFASWGGGDTVYHAPDLEALMKAVDYISLHTYPMHDTHYNPNFWGTLEQEVLLSDEEKMEKAILRAKEYAMSQYQNTVNYMKSLGIDKPVHIGETGWASSSNGFYGDNGSRATDEYKEALYHQYMREWTNKEGISCFYFEAFDEIWKDAQNSGGSENHFGLFTIDGQAKYALWDLVDKGVFEGLTRGDKTIGKTFNGDKEALLKEVKTPPIKAELIGQY
ncbi:MAG: glycosyl hydrolase family 17 protein [Chitinophagales bacterium]